jgi:hypothetical protein
MNTNTSQVATQSVLPSATERQVWVAPQVSVLPAAQTQGAPGGVTGGTNS